MSGGSRCQIIRAAVLLLSMVAIYGCASSNSHSSATTSQPQPFSQLADRHPIVLVCPVDYLTNDEKVAQLSLAMASLLRRNLFCVQQISVIPTADTKISGKPYFLTGDGLERIALSHGADIVLLGMMRGDKTEIKVELAAYDAESDYFVFRTEVRGKTSEVAKMQRQLTYRFVDALGVVLSEEEEKRLTSNTPRKLEAILEYGKGLRYEQKGKLTDALIAYGNAVDSDRRLAVPYADEGRVYKEFNAPLRAMQSYENAVGKDEFFAEAWYQLNLYAAEYKDNYEMAKRCCEKALEIAPRFGKARLSLGTRLYALGDLSQAIEETKTALELLPVDPLPRYNLGVYYLEAGKTDEARKWFEEALKINPRFSLALSELENLQGK